MTRNLRARNDATQKVGLTTAQGRRLNVQEVVNVFNLLSCMWACPERRHGRPTAEIAAKRSFFFEAVRAKKSQRQRLSVATVGSVGRQGSSLLELIRTVGNGTLAT